jgi:Spy/CpxP family protein refolding chaperone
LLYKRVKILKGETSMKKTLLALSLITVLILGVTYVYAQNPKHGRVRSGWKGEHQGNLETRKFPNLTPEQKTKFQELRRKYVEETAQLRGALVTKRVELQSLWTNPNADPKAIVDKEKELRDLQNQMKDKALQMKLEARKFLTPEQIQESGQGMGRGFGRGHMMGHGRGMGPEHGMCN